MIEKIGQGALRNFLTFGKLKQVTQSTKECVVFAQKQSSEIYHALLVAIQAPHTECTRAKLPRVGCEIIMIMMMKKTVKNFLQFLSCSLNAAKADSETNSIR